MFQESDNRRLRTFVAGQDIPNCLYFKSEKAESDLFKLLARQLRSLGFDLIAVDREFFRLIFSVKKEIAKQVFDITKISAEILAIDGEPGKLMVEFTCQEGNIMTFAAIIT